MMQTLAGGYPDALSALRLYRFKAKRYGLPMIDTAAGLLNPRAYRLIFQRYRAVSESLSGELDGVGDYRSRLFR